MSTEICVFRIQFARVENVIWNGKGEKKKKQSTSSATKVSLLVQKWQFTSLSRYGNKKKKVISCHNRLKIKDHSVQFSNDDYYLLVVRVWCLMRSWIKIDWFVGVHFHISRHGTMLRLNFSFFVLKSSSTMFRKASHEYWEFIDFNIKL